MSFDGLMSTSQRLNGSVEALAALGAELRLRRSGEAADPRVCSAGVRHKGGGNP